MSDLSIRAFDQAQRRQLYPERKGPLGVACVQRDILIACKHLSLASEFLWKEGETDKKRIESDFFLSAASRSNPLQREIALAGVQLLQITGSMGIDLFSLLKAEIEKMEMTVL